jgi:hypothetical protein
MDDYQIQLRAFAEAVRAACVQAAIDGYEQATFDGLCCEGAYEVALSAIRMLNVDGIVAQQIAQSATPASQTFDKR